MPGIKSQDDKSMYFVLLLLLSVGARSMKTSFRALFIVSGLC